MANPTNTAKAAALEYYICSVRVEKMAERSADAAGVAYEAAASALNAALMAQSVYAEKALEVGLTQTELKEAHAKVYDAD